MKNNIPLLNLRLPAFFSLYLFSIILSLIAACTSSSKRESALSENTAADLSAEALESKDSNSSVTIDYELGRDHYLFQVVSHKNSIIVKSYLAKQLLKKGPIVENKYLSFLNKANRFIDIPQSRPNKKFPCRGPFTVTVKSGGSIKTARGCRSTSEGSVSRLIREGEFLLYSEN
ncbi:MAG: hypothetical protein ABIQ95_11715 [Bdellovibrionia bacterium]